MTQAKAATVVAALVTAGYHARAHQQGAEWVVLAKATAGLVDVADIASFAVAQSVTGRAGEAVFS